MIPKEMRDAAAGAICDEQPYECSLRGDCDSCQSAALNALTAALSSARKTGLVLCSMAGGIHEGTCPTCGCRPLPSPPEEKAE